MTGPATIGESCVDRYLPPIGRDTPGGNALNVAAGLAAAGLPTAYVGAVGDDDEGRFVLAQGRARGIDMRHVAVTPGRTGRTTITVTPEGDRVFDSEVLGVSATFRPSDEAVEFLKTRSWVHATGPGEIVEALESRRRGGSATLVRRVPPAAHGAVPRPRPVARGGVPVGARAPAPPTRPTWPAMPSAAEHARRSSGAARTGA